MENKVGSHFERGAAEVLVDGDKFSLIRKRETYEDLTVLER